MSKNINVSLKSNKNNWHFTSSSLQIYDTISLISNNEKRFTQQVAEKIKAYILCSITIFRKSCRQWDNAKKYVRTTRLTYDNTVWRTRIACWIPNATDTHTHSDCIMLIAPP